MCFIMIKGSYIMERQNKKYQLRKSIMIYFVIVILTIIINIPVFIFATNDFIGNFTGSLNHYLRLCAIRPVIFPPIEKILSMCLMVNLFLLLIIEFVVVCLFHRRLNRFFRINNLFTVKKFFLLAIIIVGVQMIFSLWLWQEDSQSIDFYPVEDKIMIEQLE